MAGATQDQWGMHVWHRKYNHIGHIPVYTHDKCVLHIRHIATPACQYHDHIHSSDIFHKGRLRSHHQVRVIVIDYQSCLVDQQEHPISTIEQ